MTDFQRQDETLKQLFAKVGVETHGSCVGKAKFIVEGDILYEVESDRKCLVVPSSYRTLMQLAHTIPWSGHLGRHKRIQNILAYWCTFLLAFNVHRCPEILCHMPNLSKNTLCPKIRQSIPAATGSPFHSFAK